MTHDDLAAVEEQGWRALSTGPEAATGFYERVLDDDVVMLLPGGLVLDDRATILQSMAGPPWSAYELQDLRVLRLAADAGLVVYGVVARRGDGPEYSALISSAYARRADGWRLVLHQQTPR